MTNPSVVRSHRRGNRESFFTAEIPPLYGSDLLRERGPEIGVSQDCPLLTHTPHFELRDWVLWVCVECCSKRSRPIKPDKVVGDRI